MQVLFIPTCLYISPYPRDGLQNKATHLQRYDPITHNYSHFGPYVSWILYIYYLCFPPLAFYCPKSKREKKITRTHPKEKKKRRKIIVKKGKNKQNATSRPFDQSVVKIGA